MKFGIFYEHQLPRPWTADGEYELFHQSLDQIELADRLGYDYAWEVEHHFLEEYSHSSAPEVFLAAASQRTKQIRLGHGIVQLTTNHPGTSRRAGRHVGPAVARAGRTRTRRVGHHDRTPPLRRPLPRQARGVGGHGPVLPADVLERRAGSTTASTSTSRCATSSPSRARSRTRRCGWRARRWRRSAWPADAGMGALGFQFVSAEAAQAWVHALLQRLHQANRNCCATTDEPEHRRRVAVHVRTDRRGGPGPGRRFVVLPVRPRATTAATRRRVPGEVNMWDEYQSPTARRPKGQARGTAG